MLKPGNTKLGNIWTFSLPYRETCPGRTRACVRHCYAKKGFYVMPNVKRVLKHHLKLSKKTTFVDAIVSEIREKRVRRLRVHCSGDFWSAEYIHKWIAIVKSCPQTVFLAYTRSWRDPRMRRALIALAALPNMRLWWSTDADTVEKLPPEVPGVRVAYMRQKMDEPIPEGVDLVFRTYRNSVEKYADGVLVCPAENGTKDKNGEKVVITCDVCQLCLKKAIPNKLEAYALS